MKVILGGVEHDMIDDSPLENWKKAKEIVIPEELRKKFEEETKNIFDEMIKNSD